ncbi:MAG: hypothetical protein HW374_42 [Bacteroidetes bacterium]|nr:hypothetical protein [Bacteroidota bacterium]
MEIKRRDFIKIFGGVSGAVLFGGYGLEEVFKLPDNLVEQARKGPGVETWVNTTCGMCPGGCGMRVRLVDGIPVYVRGNPLHPVNRGGMCPLGLNALHQLYHPDRITGPLKRVGKPVGGQWESISWEEATEFIANALKDLRKEGKSHEVAFLGHDERGLMQQHVARFMKAFGSPNYYRFSATQNGDTAHALLHGHPRQPAFDILNTKLVLSFGANFLEGGYSPVYYTKLYSHHRERGTRYIQVEPRLSLTASNADRWISIRPGTYGALALGIAYIMIREELYDADFIRNRTFGFENWTDHAGVKHLGFKNMVLGNYYPDIVSEITGVPSATVLELARELGNTRPALVIGGQTTTDSTNGVFSLMAVQSLNALLGNYDKEGGIYFTEDLPLASLAPVQQDALSRKGNDGMPIGLSDENTFPLTAFSVESFVKNVLADRPYPIKVLFLSGGNPLFHSLNRHDFSEALAKIPLVVSFDSVVNETSEYAHFILPNHTFLERWDEISNVPSVNFAHASVQRPVMAPLYNTRHTADVLTELAHRLGGSVASAFPFKDYVEEIKHVMKGVYHSGEGAVVSEGIQHLWMEYLKERGWQIGRYASFEEFWNLLLERGGWWNPIRRQNRRQRMFQTSSGKFEFYSQRLKTTFDTLAKTGSKETSYNAELILNKLNISARGDTVFLPHHEPVPYDGDKPLHLITFQVLSNRDGLSSNLPMMQEMFGYSVRRFWESWIEIHPKTASMHGITDGDWVWVESSIGSLKVRAKITQGILPDAVAIPFGLGHWSSGRYAKGYGVSPNSIMRNLYDLLSGKPALEATKVRVSLATK